MIFLLELVVPELIDALRQEETEEVQAKNSAAVGVSATVAGIVTAIVVQLRAQIADPGKAIEKAEGWLAELAPRARLAFIYLATWILGPLLLFAMLVAATTVQLESTDRYRPDRCPSGRASAPWRLLAVCRLEFVVAPPLLSSAPVHGFRAAPNQGAR